MNPRVARSLRSWRVKAELQRTLARLPVGLGDRVYHLAQTAKGLRPDAKRNLAFVDRVLALHAQARGRGLAAASTVELGSGWFPTTPLAFLARGHAAHVHTFDLNRHYAPARIAQAAAALDALVPLPDALASARRGALPPSIRYHPHVDIAEAPLAPGSVDLAFSEFVLEHVTAHDLARIHERSRTWLKPDGVWIHWVSPGDHRAYSDRTLHPVDFLRYSEEAWQRIAGNRFAYHNRLRRSDYRALFERSGWRVLAEDAVVDPRTLASVRELPLDEQFRARDPADLVAGSLWFVLGRR